MDPYAVAQAKQNAITREFGRMVGAFRPALICNIGANDGHEALTFRAASEYSVVVGFEANILNYAAALKTQNFQQHRILWEFCAIGDRDGIAAFYRMPVAAEGYDWRRGASSLLPHKAEPTERVEVPIRKLDGYLADRDLLNVSKALWIDVEGATDLVLRGATEALRTTLFLKLEVEIVESWSGQALAPEIIKMVCDLGFLPVLSSETAGVPQYDVLMVSRDILDLGIQDLQGAIHRSAAVEAEAGTA